MIRYTAALAVLLAAWISALYAANRGLSIPVALIACAIGIQLVRKEKVR